jgi:transposase
VQVVTLPLKADLRIFIFSEYVDMRAGFNKLSMLVRERLEMELVDGDLFLFMGRNKRRLKALCFDGTGLLLIAKRMERGRFARLEDLEEREITRDELDIVLRGGVIRRAKFGAIPVDGVDKKAS